MIPFKPPQHTKDQSGFVLVTSLIFLVVITLLAVSAINSSTLQERMASNLRDKSLSRQAADAGLRQGELRLNDSIFDIYRPSGDCYAGDCSKAGKGIRIWGEKSMLADADKPTAFLDASIWDQTGAIDYQPGDDMPPVSFFIEEMRSNFQPRDLNPDTAAKADGGVIYRVTARSQGRNPAAVAVTQSLYEKRY